MSKYIGQSQAVESIETLDVVGMPQLPGIYNCGRAYRAVSRIMHTCELPHTAENALYDAKSAVRQAQDELIADTFQTIRSLHAPHEYVRAIRSLADALR